MNILIDILPTSVDIKGIEYEINSNFRTSILFSLLMEDDNLSEEEKVLQALNLYYPVVPDNSEKAIEHIEKAIEKIIWFYRCGEIDIKTNKSNKKSYTQKRFLSYEEDDKYIFSAFMSQYKIDLNSIKYMHWWKFKSLLDNINEDNILSKIIQYRSVDLSKITDKEQRKFYRDMQKRYALKENINKEEQALLDEWNSKLNTN